MPATHTLTDDERGFLRIVLTTPEDATAKLVYADWLEDRDDPRGPWLRAVCEGREADALRSAVDPDWAALFDGRDQFTVLLTAKIVDHLRETVPPPQPLRELRSWGTVQSDFRMAKAKPGDHVYPVQFVDGRLRILTRVRVAALKSRSDVHKLEVADGGRLDYDRLVPQPILERLRYAARRGERALTFKKDGRPTSITGLHGVFRLMPSSARDFAALVFAPEVLNDVPVPAPQPKKKRK